MMVLESGSCSYRYQGCVANRQLQPDHFVVFVRPGGKGVAQKCLELAGVIGKRLDVRDDAAELIGESTSGSPSLAVPHHHLDLVGRLA